MEPQETLQGTGGKGRKYTPQVVLFFVLVMIGLAWFWWSESGDWVIMVNGAKISAREWQKETDRAIDFFGRVYGIDLRQESAASLRAQVKQQVLAEMIDRVLLKKAAVKAGIRVDGAEIDARLAEDADRAGGVAAMQRILKEQGFSLDEYRRRLEEMLIIQKLEDRVTQNIDVSEAEIRMAYESNFSHQVSYQDVREALRQNLLAAKKNQVLTRYLKKLHEEGRIMYHPKMLEKGLIS